MTYDYDNSNICYDSSSLFYYMNNWIETEISEYTLNDNDSIVEEINRVFNDSLWEWVPETKTIYSYYSNNQLFTETTYY